MIAKKISYELRPGDEVPFFAGEPEPCDAIFRIAKRFVDAGASEPTHEQHAEIWRHVGGCLNCLRNVACLVGQTSGGLPLPVLLPKGVDQAGNPQVRIEPPPRERN